MVVQNSVLKTCISLFLGLVNNYVQSFKTINKCLGMLKPLSMGCAENIEFRSRSGSLI